MKNTEYEKGKDCPECGERMGSANCSCFERCADCDNPAIACECDSMITPEEEEMMDAMVKAKKELALTRQDKLEESISVCLVPPFNSHPEADMMFDFTKFRQIYRG